MTEVALVCQFYADANGLGQPWAAFARSGVPLAAILMPIGFRSRIGGVPGEPSQIGSSGWFMRAPRRWR